jgi:hypothetical protein
MNSSADGPIMTEAAHESFIGMLLADVATAMERHSLSGTQSHRRDLIRTTFAALEGLSWTYREHITGVARGSGLVTLEEESALSEISYQVSDQGKIVGQPRHLSMPAMIRLTTRIAVRLSPDLNIRFDTVSWERFREAISMRNRITHPKSEADLHIDDNDVSTCLSSFFWLLEISSRAMEAANAALKSHLHEFVKVFEKLKRGDPEAWAAYEAAIRSADD